MKTHYFLLIAFFSFTDTSAQVQLEEELVAQYTFAYSELIDNDYFFDISGNENHCQINGTDFSFEFDFNFNYQEAVIVGSGNTSLKLNEDVALNNFDPSKSMSFSFYTYHDNGDSNQAITPILSIHGENNAKYDLLIDNISYKIVFTHSYNNLILASIESLIPFYPESSAHLVAEINFTERKLRLFRDGSLDKESPVSSLITPFTPSISFGENHEGIYAPHVLCFDNMFIHNRALNVEEIQETGNLFFTSAEEVLLPGEAVNIFPNPVSSGASIAFEFQEVPQEVEIEVYHNNGQLIKVLELVGNKLDLEELNRGNYFLKINTSKGSIIKQLIIQ